MASILAVDDDLGILNMVNNILKKDGHIITGVTDPAKIDGNRINTYDLILLDVMMPGIDGFELCRRLRQRVDCPILFITAKTDEVSLVTGLELGADDYISKPFGVMELRARVAAHLRREKREHHTRLAFEQASFNLAGKILTVRGNEVSLTKAEYEICEFLAKNRGQVFSKEQLVEQIFGYDSESNESTIATHVKNIRNKLQAYEYEPIRTVWGIGYKWEE